MSRVSLEVLAQAKGCFGDGWPEDLAAMQPRLVAHALSASDKTFLAAVAYAAGVSADDPRVLEMVGAYARLFAAI
jgi:hypothetical protein